MSLSKQELWDGFSRELESFIRKRVADPQDAEDLLQEVFIKVHMRIDTLRETDRVTPWLYQITRNTIVDYYRARRVSHPLLENLAIDAKPEEPNAADELAAGLEYLVASLPENYRQAVGLSEIKGLKQQQVAEQLGLTLSGAKSRVQRGRQLMREALLDCCHFEFDNRGHVIDYMPRLDCCENRSQGSPTIKDQEYDSRRLSV